jgi:iron complex outermembrane receptor protein
MKLSLLQTAALCALVGLPTGLTATRSFAQNAQLSEIVVTARKRQESILNVPVVETAIPRQQLERLQINDMQDIATLVPGLSFGQNVLSIGTQVSLRGVGTSTSDPGVDQSVSLNIDGLSMSNGLAYSSSTFDDGQIEVMKGPQSLFYGKSAPGGVISIRTADPTNKVEVIARAGYEFEANQKRFEGIVSGPLTDTLKARVAGYYASSDGFFNNIVQVPLPPLGGAVASKNQPQAKDWMIRGTVLWNPTSEFDARLKINNVHDYTIDGGVYQNALCPEGTAPVDGIPFLYPGDNCKLDRNVAWVDMNPAAFPFNRLNGKDFLETTQSYGTLEMNYHPRTDLTLTSTTAYYLLHSKSDYPASSASYAGPGIEAENGFRRREWTEELRANSDFAGPWNFTAGAYFERGRVSDLVGVYGNTFIGFPAFLVKGVNIINIDTNSVFGQVRYKIVPQVELAGGVRWSVETRTNPGYSEDEAGNFTYVDRPNRRIYSSTLSPEFTITYKPTEEVTLFGSYKEGYKSGSFSIATPPVEGVDNSFGDEKVNGGEVGLKSRWLDRSLSFNLSLYDYKYTGLQVGNDQPVNGGIPVIKTVNAGEATSRGVEADVTYRPPTIEGLTLHGDVEYDRAKYNVLNNIPCYGGQTIANGCNLLYSQAANEGAGGYSSQNLSGLPLIRAAKWMGNFGIDWETPLPHEMKLIITNSQQFSSQQLVNLSLPFYQPAFIKSDISITLQGPHDHWEFAVIAKDMNNAITTGACTNSNFQGGNLPGTQITGSTGVGPAGIDEVGCIMDQGREVWLRVTYKPFA